MIKELFHTVQRLYKQREDALAKYKEAARGISASFRYPLVLTPHAHGYSITLPLLSRIACFSFLTDSCHSDRLVAIVQEIREDLAEFERQVEGDTEAAIKQAKAAGIDKKREKELMKLVLAATA